MRRTLFSIAAVTLLAQYALAMPGGINPVSAGYNGMVVYVADGEYVFTSPNPDVPGCFMGQCAGEYFWTEIANAPADEVAAREADAKAFMASRFGLDVDALAGAGAITWADVYADPRVNYRARFVTGEHVHRLGWEVHDQAFIALTNEELVLGGEFEGLVVPAGTMFPYGEYRIQKSRLVPGDGEPQLVHLDEYIRIEYQTAGPIPPPDIHGMISSACEVTESPWGSGVAQFVARFDVAMDGGPTRMNIRNVVTLDGELGLGTYPGVYND